MGLDGNYFNPDFLPLGDRCGSQYRGYFFCEKAQAVLGCIPGHGPQLEMNDNASHADVLQCRVIELAP